MMEEDNGYGTSFLVLASFIFLFMAFVFIQPNKPTGYLALPLIGDTKDLSALTLIILIIILLVILGAGIFIYRKLKKSKLPELPNAFSSPTDLNLPSPQSIPLPQKENKQELDLDNFNKLFSEQMKEAPEVIKPLEIKQQPQKDLQELKIIIQTLFKKNYTKESIFSYLQKKGYTLNEIKLTIDKINEENLSKYINDAKSLGYTREQIINSLVSKGWNLEDIKKLL